MLKSLKLHGVGPVRDLSASFGERLNIVTGDNGLGKSFLLDVCFWSLTGTWPGGRVAIPDGKEDAPTIKFHIESKTKPATPRELRTTISESPVMESPARSSTDAWAGDLRSGRWKLRRLGIREELLARAKGPQRRRSVAACLSVPSCDRIRIR